MLPIDWNQRTFAESNENLGDFVSPESIRREAREPREEFPEKQQE